MKTGSKSGGNDSSAFRKYVKPVIRGIIAAVALIFLWGLLKIFVFGYFPVPSDSMRPSIIPGDVVFVNKLKLGPRTFRSLDFLDSDTVAVRNIRFPGYGSIKRNEVIVFNYPYADLWYKARFNYKKYFVKRCIGLPGDTLSIANGVYMVAGYTGSLGNLEDQRRLSGLSLDNMVPFSSRTNRPNGWTIKDFGPLYIPREGDMIKLDNTNFEFYRRIIEWEMDNGRIVKKGNKYYLGKTEISQYKVRNNYYFVAGDNVLTSRDSRYWGLLQEEYIVGICPFILYSKDRQTGKIRWNRFFKTLDL